MIGLAAARARPARLVLLAALLLAALWPQSGAAHAELREATPAAGEIFRWARPEQVRLRFTQPLASGMLLVTNRHFEPFHRGEATLDRADARTVVAPLAALPPGTYTVTWRTVSVDGHPLEGAYDFTVLPREPLITLAVAATVLPLFALFVYYRRERPAPP